MKAIVTYNHTDPPTLSWEDVPDVVPRPGEVLVQIKASAVNRADLSQAAGNYPPPPGITNILGLEMSGQITALGQGVTNWQIGQRVLALLPGGGYAQYTTVPQDMLIELPPDWSYQQGAAIAEVWLTAYTNLFIEGQLQAGQNVLIHAGASGVGTAAIQLAHQAGAIPYATAGTAAKIERCHQLGAKLAINYKKQDFLTQINQATNNQGLHLILDPVGANYLDRNMKLLQPSGRLIHIGLLSGHKTDINLGLILGKSLRLIGSRLRPRPLAEKIAITQQFKQRFWPHFLTGRLQPIIDTTFPLPQAQQAHTYIRQNRNIGKVILTL